MTNSAAYVARVGRLAVALGIGTAVATGQGVALADSPDAGSSSAGSPSTDSASAGSQSPPSVGASSSVSEAGTSPSTGSSSTGPQPSSDAGGDPRSGIVYGSGGAHTSAKPSAEPTQTAPGEPSATFPDMVAKPTVPQTPQAAKGSKVTPGKPARRWKIPTGVSPAGIDTRSTTVSAEASRPQLDQHAAAPPPATTVSGPSVLQTEPAVSQATPVTVTTQMTAPSSTIRPVSAVITAALTWMGLSPALTGSPVAPVESPTMLAMLAGWRRQSRQALTGEPTNVADLPQTSQTAAPIVTGDLNATGVQGDQAPADTSTMQSSAPMNLTLAAAAVTLAGTAPTAGNDAATTREDTQVVVRVLANDRDVDGDALTTSVVTGPVNGTVTHNADGSFTYAPKANFNGTDTFTYRVSDGTFDSNPATVTVTVTAVNDAPVANPDVATTAEDTPVLIDVKANDTDVENSPLSPVLVTNPANGTVVANAGKYTYTPKANFTGTDSFTYRISENPWWGPQSAPVTVTVTVTAVNDAPTAVTDSATTKEDTPVVVNVKANDKDVDGDALTTSVVTGPVNGTVTHNVDGSFSYAPKANFNGTDTFTYRASDGTLDSAPATVTVKVTAVNDVPIANPDTAITKEDTRLVLNIKANDTDADNNALFTAVLTNPANGTVVDNYNGTYSYIPKANFTGTDTFTYRVSDGAANSAPATVTIIVTAVNDAPTAANDAATTKEDTPVVINVKANDTDPDGDALTATVVTGPANGTLTQNADGTFTYAPKANYNGTDSFTYRESDGTLDSAPGRVTVTVTAVNDAPVANPDTAATNANTRLVLNVRANDTDAENTSLTTAVVTNPANGTVVRNWDGTFTYTPKTNFIGTDTFTYRASDGAATSNPATVTISVNSTTAFTATTLASGLTPATDFRFLPDGRILIAQKGGTIKVANANGQLQSTPLITLPTDSTGTRGLLGIAVDPTYGLPGGNNYVYAVRTLPRDASNNTYEVLTRITVTDPTAAVLTADPASEVVLVQGDQPGTADHFGGGLSFGPDGKLYLSVGDNVCCSVIDDHNAQSLTNIYGKVLRLNPDGTAPSDNPFVNTPGADPRIYAYGFRNPFRLTFTPDGKLLVGDVGQATWEELDLVTAGANYGWYLAEGPCNGIGVTNCATPSSYTNPIYAYVHNGFSSITSVMVYTGPGSAGGSQHTVLIADNNQGWVKQLTCTSDYSSCGNATTFNYATGGATVQLAQGPDGAIYQLTIDTGRLTRIAPTIV